MKIRIYSREYASRDANLLVPSFLVQMDVLAIKFIEEVGVTDV